MKHKTLIIVPILGIALGGCMATTPAKYTMLSMPDTVVAGTTSPDKTQFQFSSATSQGAQTTVKLGAWQVNYGAYTINQFDLSLMNQTDSNCEVPLIQVLDKDGYVLDMVRPESIILAKYGESAESAYKYAKMASQRAEAAAQHSNSYRGNGSGTINYVGTVNGQHVSGHGTYHSNSGGFARGMASGAALGSAIRAKIEEEEAKTIAHDLENLLDLWYLPRKIEAHTGMKGRLWSKAGGLPVKVTVDLCGERHQMTLVVAKASSK